MPKVSIIGSGNIGATVAHLIAIKKLADMVLVDVVEGLAEGKALDIHESAPIEGFDIKIEGSHTYEATKNSDIIVITAGLARKPGMSRDDLLKKNTEIVKSVTEQVVKYSPNSILIVVSNPLDAMVFVASEVSKFPKNRIVGMAGILDTSRFKTFIADELDVSVNDIEAFVLGGHGRYMVPMIQYTNVAGKPLTELLDKDTIEKLIQRTRDAGIEIVNFLKTGSAYYSPASSIVEMITSILKDENKILPCAAYLDGEYNVKGYFIGVPVKLGKNGIEDVVKFKLDEEETKLFDQTVEHVKKLSEQTRDLL